MLYFIYAVFLIKMHCLIYESLIIQTIIDHLILSVLNLRIYQDSIV